MHVFGDNALVQPSTLCPMAPSQKQVWLVTTTTKSVSPALPKTLCDAQVSPQGTPRYYLYLYPGGKRAFSCLTYVRNKNSEMHLAPAQQSQTQCGEGREGRSEGHGQLWAQPGP